MLGSRLLLLLFGPLTLPEQLGHQYVTEFMLTVMQQTCVFGAVTLASNEEDCMAVHVAANFCFGYGGNLVYTLELLPQTAVA